MADELESLERRALAEELASALRHDLRNKLSAIRNAAFYLERCAKPTELWQTNPRVAEFFALITEQVNEANAALELRVASTDGAPVEAISISACVDLALQRARVPATITVHQELEEVGTIDISGSELTLAIRCVVDNAIEAMEGHGIVTIRVSTQSLHAVISVADIGPGFSAEQRERGIAALESSKAGHLGLGLAVVRRIVSRYGGTLTLGATNGHGLVELILPLAAGK